MCVGVEITRVLLKGNVLASLHPPLAVSADSAVSLETFDGNNRISATKVTKRVSATAL